MPITVALIVLIAIVAALVLTYPVFRAIARAIEQRFVTGPRSADVHMERGLETPLIRQLESRVSDLEQEQERLQEQQEFLESLLEKRKEPPALEPPDQTPI